MTTTLTLRAGVCLSALIAAPAAFADVTAQQVWSAWQSDVTDYIGDGTLTTGDIADSGNTVTVTDLVLTSAADGTTLTLTIPQIVFTGQTDGTVDVTSTQTLPMTVVADDGMELAATLTQTGAVVTASGTPEDLAYDIAADRYVFSIDSLTSPDGDMTGDMRLTLNGVTGTTSAVTGEMRDSQYAIAVTSVDLLADVTTPDTSTLMLSGKIDGIVTEGTSSAPADMDFSDPVAVFSGDYTAAGTYTSGTAAYIISVGGPMSMDGTSTTGPSNLNFGIGPQGITYEGGVTDVAASLTGSEMPFPLQLSAASYGFGLTTPLVPTDTPAPFRLLMDLSEVTVNDEIWAMFDPTAALSRDPATIRLDVSGEAQLDVAVMDPAAAEAMAMAPGFPGTLQSLTLNELTIDAVGLSVDGTGDFTFDNADTTTFPGMPRPEGQITLNATGINGLVDQLIAMGLVPADQAMMGRMMLGMFATPTGDDAVQSVIAINPAGEVTANGQRIR